MDEAEKRRIIRDAATIVLLRQREGRHQVLMGQRGAGAVFMPNKYVFPGGAVDAQDYTVPLGAPLNDQDATRLAANAPDGIGNACAVAAIRELWEETGLVLGSKSAPRADALRFIFRAVTPPGRPRRFDARFFIADTTTVCGSDEDFSDASDELSHLHWIDLTEAKALDLPFVTEVVLSEVIAITHAPDEPRRVPFFNHDNERSHFTML